MNLRTVSVCFTLVVLMAGCNKDATDRIEHRASLPIQRTSPQMVVDNGLEQAERQLLNGNFHGASELVLQTLDEDPRNPTALEIAIECSLKLGRFADAADLAIRLAELQPSRAPGLLINCFDWNLKAGRYDVAESNLLMTLKSAPDNVEARRLLVQLYNAQGRRIETREHVEELVRLKAVNWQETLSLIDLRGPFTLISFDDVIDVSRVSLFSLGKLRTRYASFQGERDQVIRQSEQIAEEHPESAAAAAFYGRVLAENGRYERLPEWFADLPDGIEEQPEYWTTLAVWSQQAGQHQSAIRGFAEALRLDPSHREAIRQMIASFDAIGGEQQAIALRERLAVLDQIFRIAREADAEQAMWIAVELQKLMRPWEALAWVMRSAQLKGNFPQVIPELHRRAAMVSAWENSTISDQIERTRLDKLLGFDLEKYPLPEPSGSLAKLAEAKPDEAEFSVPARPLRFNDVASDVGLLVDTPTGYFAEDSFYAYQVDGSGIAVLDYDLDDRPDLYVMQSGGKPNDPTGSTANQLFRQLPDGSFSETTIESRTGDRAYGAGVAVGDVNQDGFPDLLLGNVGSSVLFLNQGDGTFRDASGLIRGNEEVWTSSFAIADLSGDHLPELIQVNYIDDPRAFEIRCVGGYLHCQPQQFRAASDRIFKGNADGTFSSWTSITGLADDPKLGLGVLVANFDKQHGNDFFVANDGDLNHFWTSTPASKRSDDPFELVESAIVRGCSVGQGGVSQACMGVAAGDFNRDGMLDMQVTNFYNEPVNLFVQNRSGFFSDQAMSFGLSAATLPVLGFGSQSSDFDNDGWLDLATLNGHVFDARDEGIPFRMRSQLFRGGPRGFSLEPVETAGEYWRREHLGRALAVWDVNRDGRMDLVGNHLDQPVAILKNISETQNWLQVELIGTQSERDAIGAVVTIHANANTWTAFRTAGDGYMVSNDALLHFGVGESLSIDRVEIAWPSGVTQTFRNVPANARYLSVEDLDDLFVRGK